MWNWPPLDRCFFGVTRSDRPITAFWLTGVSRSRMIFWSLLAWSLVTLCTAMVQDAHQLLATRVLLGFAESAYLPAAIALIADHHGAKTRGTALGIHLAGLSVGLVAGGAGAGYAGDHFGWRFAFVFLGCVGLVLAGLTRAVLRDVEMPPDPVRRSPVRDVLELARIPSYVILLSEAMLISVGTWIFFNWLPLYFKERYGMSLTMAGFSGTFIPQVATVAGVVLGGYFFRPDRTRPFGAAHDYDECLLHDFGTAPLRISNESFGQRSKRVHFVLLFSARVGDFERRTADLRLTSAAAAFDGYRFVQYTQLCGRRRGGFSNGISEARFRTGRGF